MRDFAWSVLMATFLIVACSGCQNAPSGNLANDAEWERQSERYEQQADKVDEQAERLDKMNDKTEEQAERFDQLLDRWDAQAERYDKILDKWEKQPSP